MSESNGQKADVDLSSLMPGAEPLTIQVGETVYTADLDMGAGDFERIVTWCNSLTTAGPEADAASVALVAGAFNLTDDEAAAMRPRLRRSMLLFFVTGRPVAPTGTT